MKCLKLKATNNKKFYWWIILIAIAVRVIYSPFPELIPEEAYYWLYAQNLSMGYLDHPPVVAWLVWLGTSLFGDSALGVRIGAHLCWIVGAFFLWRFSRDLFGDEKSKETALITLMLYSCLPFFFGIGLTVAPDSPLIAFWCGAVFFLHRALVAGKASSWYLVGVMVGLGMLSKYTIVLLGPATMLFCVLDKPSRSWFFRFEPYIAAIISLIIFSPVILWNATHDWASFAFQGPRRMAAPAEFSLHFYLLDLLVLVTPAGVLGAYVALKNMLKSGNSDSDSLPIDRRSRLLIELFSIVPLVVFALNSIFHENRLNWAGPAFIPLLPILARQLVGGVEAIQEKALRAAVIIWKPMLVALMIIYIIVLHYMSFGFPMIPFSGKMVRFIGWSSLAQETLKAAEEEKRGDRLPLIVGMDKHNIASELLFYMKSNTGKESPTPIVGRSFFGEDCLMFAFWDRSKEVKGKDMLLISRRKNDLRDDLLLPRFREVAELREIKTSYRGKPVGVYYYRVGREFH